MQSIPDEIIYGVRVKWTRPIDYDHLIANGNPHEYKADLYMITARFSTAARKIAYIGKAYHQGVVERLKQPDHKKRLADIRKRFKKHRIQVSCGIVEIKEANRTANRIDDIESLLIFSSELRHSVNLCKIWSHGVSVSYDMLNLGYRSGLPRRIRFGIFIQK